MQYQATILKIQRNVPEKFLRGKYAFLKRPYAYAPKSDGGLTHSGERQMEESGRKFYQTYPYLAEANQLYVRTSGKDRVDESARLFLRGYNNAKEEAKSEISGGFALSDSDIDVKFDEEGGTANPLRPKCPGLQRSDAGSSIPKDHWAIKFTRPIRRRLNKDLRSAFLNTNDVIILMHLCAFQTAAASPEASRFCDLFQVDEWRDYDYFMSLEKWYRFGPGRFLGPTQGVGFVNELIARLTHTPVQDQTSTNAEVNARPENYQRNLYADFTSDNKIIAIFSALGLFNETRNLDRNRRQSTAETAGFAASWVVPFGARAYLERMRCESPGGPKEWVRFLVNDRIVPLSYCPPDTHGRCLLNTFLEKLTFAKQGGHWPLCSAKLPWVHKEFVANFNPDINRLWR
ncbi:MAG: hypothetical protein Q9160_003881 [Pyrenula sp. 1 TL-2023]